MCLLSQYNQYVRHLNLNFLASLLDQNMPFNHQKVIRVGCTDDCQRSYMVFKIGVDAKLPMTHQ